MSKKSTKTKASKTTKAKKAKVKPEAAPQHGTDECPRGGQHEWTEEGDERFCAKCKEPASKGKAQKQAKVKKAKESKDKKLRAIDLPVQDSLRTSRGEREREFFAVAPKHQRVATKVDASCFCARFRFESLSGARPGLEKTLLVLTAGSKISKPRN